MASELLLRFSLAGTIGMKPPTATPQPVFSCEADGAVAHSLRRNLRTVAETPTDSGASAVPVELTVCWARHLLSTRRRPPCPSGAPESRCGGRTSATAISTLIQ